MSVEEIRWQQRFSNYRKALECLEDFLEPPALNECEQQGLIKAFENTYELAWNTLRDLLRSQGYTSLLMLQDRNLTSHAYNRATADAIAAQIIDCYLPCFQQLRSRLEQRVEEEAP